MNAAVAAERRQMGTKPDEFDVCVIGTGAGGGVMIQELTAAGFRVVALQRGPFLQPGQFDDDELRTVIRDEVFSPDQVETYRYDDASPTETVPSNPADLRSSAGLRSGRLPA